MSWHHTKPEIYDREISYIRSHLPDVRDSVRHGHVVLLGPFPVTDGHGETLGTYDLQVVFPVDYPNWIPDVFLKEQGIPPIAERHLETSGRACLCLPHEIPEIVGIPVTFQIFHERLLTPWLIGQVAFDRDGKWPWDARGHNLAGIVEAYREITGFPDEKDILAFIRLLVRKNPAKGHEPCPCGSGLRLRHCHNDLYRTCLQNLPAQAMTAYRRSLTGAIKNGRH